VSDEKGKLPLKGASLFSAIQCYICPQCNYHVRIGSHDYFDIIFDGKYKLLFNEIISKDILGFSDLKTYQDRLIAAKQKTDLNDSISVAKTSVKLAELSRAKLPYFSFMTDPTTGGVTASFAMLGDINFAEPEALIGFAGPRVIKETIKRDLPEGFQTSEFLLDHGFLDFIVDRKDLKARLAELLQIFDVVEDESVA